MPYGYADQAVIMLAILLGSLASGLTGFAFPAVAGGPLLHVMSAAEAVLLMATCSTVLNVLNLVLLRRVNLWREAMPYIFAGIIGTPIGVALVSVLDKRTVSVTFGAAIIAYSVWTILRPPRPERGSGGRPAEALVGFLGGIAGGMLALPGTVLIVWCGLRGYSKDHQRGLLQPYAFAMMLASAVLHAIQGNFALTIAIEFVLSLPALIVGTVVGLKAFGRINDALFRHFVVGLLILSGVTLIIRAMQ